MIVLDEQLLGRDLDGKISKWYRGPVHFITDLRPNTVIKDNAVPRLLRQQNQPTFVTINTRDFWRKVLISSRYCVICFTLSDSRAGEIPHILRGLFRHPEFNTKSKRMGKIIRVTSRAVSYYSYDTRDVKILEF